MKTDDLHQNFLNVLKSAAPPGINLATFLADTLCLGKEAVYRRIRGDVPFTFYEVSTVARILNISIDNIIGTSIKNSAIFHIDKDEYIDPEEKHYASFENCIRYFKMLENDPVSSLSTSCNIIPFVFFMRKPHIIKFKTFKWMYQQKNIDELKSYHQIRIPDRLMRLHHEHGELLTKLKRSTYTLDSQLFEHVVNDIKYCHSVHLLDDEDIAGLKEELLEVTEEMEQIAAKGRFENGNKVRMYISNLKFDTNYTCIESQNIYLAQVHVFILNALSSFDREIFDDIKNLIKFQQRFSTLISEAGEIQRVQFFRQQRELISDL